MPRHWVYRCASVGLLCVILVSTGCVRGPLWRTTKHARVTDRAIADALDDHEFGASDALRAEDVPVIPAPKSLRPCCAFGNALKVKLGALPLPLFALDNIRGPEDLGPHKYDNGIVTIDRSDDRGWIDREKNGLVYTCRGGFIDIAHVRDNADLTLFLTVRLGREMEVGSVIDLPNQGGAVQAVHRPLESEIINLRGRARLATALAEWLALQMSIWHEIATWYGYAALNAWPEKLSAFSPEDMYSNLLGIKIAGAIINAGHAPDDHAYNRSMDDWLRRILQRLQAVPKESGKAAIDEVDGLWWDSSKRLPDWRITLRRHMNVGPTIDPWLVSMAPASSPDECPDPVVPLYLHQATGLEGVDFADIARFEVEVGAKLIKNGFPLPEPGRRVITQADFPFLIDAMRTELQGLMGPDVDRAEVSQVE